MTKGSPEMSLGQFVKQLAGRLQEDGIALPFKNQMPWHLLFYELRKYPSEGKPQFLDTLVFDWDAPYPKCQELAEFLSALHFTASASARNPRFDVISVDHTTAERWSRITDQGDPRLKTFVIHAVSLAKKEFGAMPKD